MGTMSKEEILKILEDAKDKNSDVPMRLVRQAFEKLPEPCEDADKLKRCRFEYINACKTVTYPTPDTNKNDINDAYAVIKALNPIFGDEEF